MSLMDEIMRDAMSKGEFSNLPGQGKPLNLENDPNTPEHLRVTYKLLKDNDLAPAWIEQGHGLDKKRKELSDDLRQSARKYRGALNDAAYSANPEQERQRAEKVWRAAQARIGEAAAQFNREVLTYNLKVPKGVTHKSSFNVGQEVAKLYLP